MIILPKEIMSRTNENHFSKFSRKSSLLFLSIVFLILAILGSMPFIKVNISIQSRGIIRSENEPTKIISPITEIVDYINMNENSKVDKGDTLITFRNDKIETTLNHLNRKKNIISDLIEDQENILSGNYGSLKTQKYINELSQYLQKLKEYELEISLKNKEFERAQSLYAKNVIPKKEFETIDYTLKKIKEEKIFFTKQFTNNLATNINEQKLTYQSIESELQQTLIQQQLYTITATTNGYITGYTGIKTGDIVYSNQPIANITPTNNLIIESFIPPNSIGYLKPGMISKFQIDAYNYNEWGLASGQIIDIANQPTQINNNYFFRIRYSLNQNHLTQTSGARGKLKNGLTLTARCLVTERSLFQLLYDKSNDWMNPKLLTYNTESNEN